MVDKSKLKRKILPDMPVRELKSNNLDQPEVAPAGRRKKKTKNTKSLPFLVSEEFFEEFTTAHFNSRYKYRWQFLQACFEAYKQQNNLK